MRLRAVLAAGLASVACTTSSNGAQTPRPPSSALRLTVDAAHPGPTLPASFLGLGFEFNDVLNYTGEGAGAPRPAFQRLLQNVQAAGSGPLPWRIGGNSTDDSWWNPQGRPRPPGIGYDITGPWVESVSKAAADAGAPIIVGLNLVLDDPAAAADWAQVMQAALGGAGVQAFEVGNEPNAYSVRPEGTLANGQPRFARPRPYEFQHYANDYAAYAAAVRSRLGPRTPLAGPAAFSAAWMAGLPGFLARMAGSVDVVTYHQYPLSVCGKRPGDLDYPTIDQLLGEDASHGLAFEAAPFARQAAAHGLPLRVAEANSVVCFGASGVSDTFAAALWLTDALFEYASVGVAGVNVQTISHAFYAPFVLGAGEAVTVRPDYYSLLLAAPALRPGARLLPVSGAPPGLKAWATLGTDRTLRLVLVNKTRSHAFDLQVVAGSATAARSGTLVRLGAPSLESTTGVALGGQTFDGTTSGLPSGRLETESSTSRDGTFTVTLPAASAAAVTVPG
jgi:hypothetical protein